MEEKPGKINVTISTSTILTGLFWVVLLLLAYAIRDILLIVLTSVVIASAIEPATKWFRKYKIPRVIGVLIVYIIAVVVISGAIYFFVPVFAEELAGVPDLLPSQIQAPESLVPAANTLSFITDNLSKNYSLHDIISSPTLIGQFFKTAGGLFNGLVSFVLIVVISFYLAVQEKGVESFLRIATPWKYEPYVLGLWKRTEIKIGGWAQGQLLLGLIIGPLVYLGLVLFQIKYALLLAIVAAIFELIPVFGPVLSAVPAVLIGFSQSITLGFIILAFYIIVQQFENHLIYPLVVKKIIGVPPLIVILALIIGAKLAGFLGIILSVPLAALIMEIAGDIEKRKLLRQSESK